MKVNIKRPKKLRPLFETKKKYIAIEGGRNSAKSWGIADFLINECLTGKRILCFREIQRSLKESSYQLVLDTIDRMGLNGYFTSINNEIRCNTGGKMVFIGLKGGSKQEELTRLKSLEGFDIGWNEEASSTSQQSLDLIMPTFRKKGAKVVFSYNRIEEADPVHKTLVMTERDDVEHIYITYLDNPYCTDDMLKEAEALKKSDPDKYRHVYLGEPLNQSDNAIIKISDVRDAMERKANTEGQIQIGADIARYGTDSTVFSKRKGLTMTDLQTFRKQSIPEVARRLILFANSDKKIPIKIDDTGVGGGVTDILTEQGYNVIPVNNGEKAIDKDKYNNAISEQWFTFAENINSITLLQHDKLKQELTTRYWKINSKGQRVVESKDEYKMRGFGSPDSADSVLLCFYECTNKFKMTSSKVAGWG